MSGSKTQSANLLSGVLIAGVLIALPGCGGGGGGGGDEPRVTATPVVPVSGTPIPTTSPQPTPTGSIPPITTPTVAPPPTTVVSPTPTPVTVLSSIGEKIRLNGAIEQTGDIPPPSTSQDAPKILIDEVLKNISNIQPGDTISIPVKTETNDKSILNSLFLKVGGVDRLFNSPVSARTEGETKRLTKAGDDGESMLSFTIPADTDPGEVCTELVGLDDSGLTSNVEKICFQVTSSSTPPPIVNAGSQITVAELSSVTISGIASSSAGISSLVWEQTSGPSVSFSDGGNGIVSFQVPDFSEPAQILFRLTATANDGQSNSDTVQVNVPNLVQNMPPLVNAGPDLIVDEGAQVVLSGLTTDSDGVLVDRGWVQLQGSPAALQNVSGSNLSFLAPEVSEDTVLVFQLGAQDEDGASSQDQVEVVIRNVPNAVIAAPDLVISNFVAPNRVQPGDQLPVSFTLENRGTGGSGSVDVGFYISEQAPVTVEDPFLFFETVDVPAPGGSQSYSFVFVAPQVSNGFFQLAAIADDIFVVPESDESNNVSAPRTLEFSGGEDRCTADSFEQDDAAESATLITLGQTSTHNHCSDASDFVAVDLVAGTGYRVFTERLGDFADTTLTLFAPDGTTHLRFDDDGGAEPLASRIDFVPDTTGRYFIRAGSFAMSVGDSREYDITVEQTGSAVTTGPSSIDLRVSSLTVPATAIAGETVQATFELTNAGGQPSSGFDVGMYASFDNTVTLNDVFFDFRTVDGLAAGESRVESFAFFVPEESVGDFQVAIIADDVGSVGESNENNNVSPTQPLTVNSGQQQQCSNDAFESDDSPAEAGVIGIGSSQSRNHCDDALDYVRLPLQVGSQYIIQTSQLGVDADTTLALLFPDGSTAAFDDDGSSEPFASVIEFVPAQSGDYVLIVGSFAGNTGVNREYTLTVSEVSAGGQSGAVDLIARDLNLTAADIVDGEDFTANFVIDNLGSGASAPYDAGLYLYEDRDLANFVAFIGYVSLPSLAGGQSEPFSGSFTLPTGFIGDYFLTVQADDVFAIEESNEANNFSEPVGVSIRPSGGAASCVNDDFEEDDQFATFSLGVGEVQDRNHCDDGVDLIALNLDAATSYLIESFNLGPQADTVFRLLDPQGNEVAFDDDGGSESLASFISFTPQSSGTYLLIVESFSGQSGDEREYSVTLSTGAAPTPSTVDLQITFFDVANTTPDAGGDFPVSFGVTNSGSGASPGFDVGIYMTSQETGELVFIGFVSFGELPANGSDSFQGSFTLPVEFSGAFDAFAQADDVFNIDETNEDNNFSVSVPINVSPGSPPLTEDCVADAFEENDSPDQALSSLPEFETQNHNFCDDAFDYSSVNLADNTRYVFETFNLGSAADTVIELFDSAGNFIGSNDDGGDSLASRLEVDIVNSGSYLLLVRSFDGATGSGREYSVNFGGVAQTGTPDLSAETFGAPETASAESLISVQFVVANVGDGSAGAFDVGIYLSSDSVIDTSTDQLLSVFSYDGLDVGASIDDAGDVFVPAVAEGNYTIGFVADDVSAVNEVSEDNNQIGVPITISGSGGGGDISATNSYGFSFVRAVGDPIIIGGEASNLGTGTSEGFVFNIYASTDGVLDASDTILYSESAAGLNAQESFFTEVEISLPNLSEGFYQLLAEVVPNANDADASNNIFAGDTIEVVSCFADGGEDDDSTGTAFPIASGQSAIRNFCDDGADVFAVTLEAGVAYEFFTDQLGIEADTTLSLIDTDGATQLAFDDDGGSETLASYIGFTPEVAGTYYLAVNPFGRFNLGGGTDYRFNMN